MDNYNTVFGLEEDDEDEQHLIYPPPNYSSAFHHDQQDLLTDLPPLDSFLEVDTNNKFDSNKTKNNNKKKSSALQVEKCTTTTTAADKKVTHKEMERQRRQEMSNLYASLRQLLPLEYLKGKRSTSDHILEAVNYIEHLQKKVRNLEDDRDKLKTADVSKSGSSSSSTHSLRTIVKVRPCLDGMEIFINWGLTNEGICLSRLLRVLLQEGLTILNCTCNKVNGKLLHSIRTEVSSPAITTDAYELQQKLAATIQTNVTLLD